MARGPHIFLFSVHKDAMDAAVRAFAADWPQAQISNLLDDSLFTWVRDAGGVVPEMHDVFRNLTRHMAGRGADGILFTCSAFRQVIDACIADFELPILKPNDAMIAKALDEVRSRHAEATDEECRTIATQISVGALRYFMLRFTRTTVIAFDLQEALSFEGETGPYVQYAAVRARKAATICCKSATVTSESPFTSTKGRRFGGTNS